MEQISITQSLKEKKKEKKKAEGLFSFFKCNLVFLSPKSYCGFTELCSPSGRNGNQRSCIPSVLFWQQVWLHQAQQLKPCPLLCSVAVQNLTVSDHSTFIETFTKISLDLLLLNCTLRHANTTKIRKKYSKTLSEKPCISSGFVSKLDGVMKFAWYRGKYYLNLGPSLL